MTRDTFDKFQPPDRGRFGDNEMASPRASRPRVTGASDLIDLDLVLHHATDKAILVSIDGNEHRAVWLPKAAIEFEPQPPPYVTGTLKNGRQIPMARVEVTLPGPLAKAKGLI